MKYMYKENSYLHILDCFLNFNFYWFSLSPPLLYFSMILNYFLIVQRYSENIVKDGLCNKDSAPSVSSISRVLRGGGHTLDGDMDGRPSHSIDGILGEIIIG